jgi:hypothetical protein
MTQILDARTVRSIARMQDHTGILSIYIRLRDEASGGPDAGSKIEIENLLRELGNRVRTYGDHAYVAAFQACADWVVLLIESLAGSPGEGRSCAIFCGLESAEVVQIPCGVSLHNAVRLGPVASLAPLLVAEAAGRPFGVVALHRDKARVYSFKNGAGVEIAELVLEPDSGDWRQMEGPAFAAQGSSQASVSLRDQFDDRVKTRVGRSIDLLAGNVAGIGTAERWDLLVVSGDPRLTNDFKVSFRPDGQKITLVEDDHVWGDSSAAEVVRRSAPLAANARRERAASLAAEVVHDSAFADRAVLGFDATLHSLASGRVHVLLFDTELCGNGSGADGSRLDRAVRDAVVSGIEVVPLSGEAAATLGGAGSAARLYW